MAVAAPPPAKQSAPAKAALPLQAEDKILSAVDAFEGAAERLAQEWGMTEEQVFETADGLGWAFGDKPPEFRVWGFPRTLADRQVDLSGFAALPVPASSRRAPVFLSDGEYCP